MAARRSFLYLFTCYLLAAIVNAQQTFWPAAVPMAVRTPYLNSWQVTENGTKQNPFSDWTRFWTRNHITAWEGHVKVDDTTWRFLGGWPIKVNDTVLESFTVTPTRTQARIRCGPVLLNVTFLSPIEPEDLVKQSLPLSYMAVDVQTLDNQPHSISLYTDISGEWVSNNDNTMIQWETLEGRNAIVHSVRRANPLPLTEDAELSEDSAFHYATAPRSDLKWHIGGHFDARNTFVEKGSLPEGKDVTFRNINDNYPVLAYSVNLGSISSTSSPVVWAIGQEHDPSALYSPDGVITEKRSAYWRTQYNADVHTAMGDFLADFPAADARSRQLDDKIITAAEKVSPEYVNLVSLAARQVFAATEVTSVKNIDGSWNTTNIRTFLKDIGTTSRINPVETLYASLPFFLYIDPGYMGHLLEPHLEYATSVAFSLSYAAGDLGALYPNATGNAQAHERGVENSSSMIIMALAHAKYTGDNYLLVRYYSLLKGWTDYLVANSPQPTNQETADGIKSTEVNSNLAIKGIIAIGAMSEISKVLGQTGEADQYWKTASEHVVQWKTSATLNNQITLRYGNVDAFGLLYNLYADRLLKMNLVPEEVYSTLADTYSSRAGAAPRFGFEFDSNERGIVKSHWLMFTAAALWQYPVAQTMVNMVHNRASTNSTPGVFPSVYKSDTGETVSGSGSSQLGAMYSFLALDLEPKTIPTGSTAAPPSPTGPGSNRNGAVRIQAFGTATFIGVVMGLSFLI